jgi:hypothetical protein
MDVRQIAAGAFLVAVGWGLFASTGGSGNSLSAVAVALGAIAVAAWTVGGAGRSV